MSVTISTCVITSYIFFHNREVFMLVKDPYSNLGNPSFSELIEDGTGKLKVGQSTTAEVALEFGLEWQPTDVCCKVRLSRADRALV